MLNEPIDYKAVLTHTEKTLKAYKFKSDIKAVDLLVLSLTFEEMKKNILGGREKILPKLYNSANEWYRTTYEIFDRVHRPYSYQLTKYRKKEQLFAKWAFFQKQRSKNWRRYIIDSEHNIFYVEQINNQLQAVIIFTMDEFREWVALNQHRKDFLTWNPEEANQKMLSERPDLVTAIRLAQRLGVDVRQYSIHQIKKPWYVDVVEMGISFIPIIGNTVAAYESSTGRDLFGYALSPTERAIIAASVLLPFAGRMVKSGRALYTSERMVKLYGKDTKSWSRMLATGERLSSNPEELLLLRRAAEIVRNRGTITKKMAAAVEKALKKTRPGIVAASSVEVSSTIKNIFATLSVKHKILADLDELAIQRIVQNGSNVNHIKGQLLEELLETRILTFLKDPLAAKALGIHHVPTEELRFIPGYLVRDTAGRQISDGLLVRQVSDHLEIITIFEAKAGKSAARQLKLSSTSMKKMSIEDIAELNAYAKDIQRELIEFARLDGTKRIKSIEQIKKEIIKSEKGGQVRRDIERLDQNVDGELTKLRIGGVAVPVKVSPTQTSIFGVLPNDIKIGKLTEDLVSLGYNFDIFGIDISSKELIEIAQKLSKLAL